MMLSKYPQIDNEDSIAMAAANFFFMSTHHLEITLASIFTFLLYSHAMCASVGGSVICHCLP